MRTPAGRFAVAALAATLLSPWTLHAHDSRPGRFPTRRELDAGPWRARHLPPHRGVTLALGGCPADLESLRALIDAMRSEGVGNGFDPGPGVDVSHRPLYELLREVGWPVVGYASTADHQVKDGTCFLSEEREAISRILADAGIFTATQLGEWGYYFHNLSHAEPWWRAVYGDEFEERRRHMKPKGLAGFDRRPETKRECHDILEDYFRTRQRAMRGWSLSVTGHSHYEAWVGQWGARVIGLELGENIAFTQSKIAFARGASRRTDLPWSIQVSPWFHGSCTTHGALRAERELLPVRVAGDPVEYQVNRTDGSWVVELVNHRGLIKHPTRPAVLDPSAVATVLVTPRAAVAEAREWITGARLAPEPPIRVVVPAGGTAFLELTEREKRAAPRP